MDCLSYEAMVAWVEGDAPDPAAVDDHLDGCDACRRLVAALARSPELPACEASAGASTSLCLAALELDPQLIPGTRFRMVRALGRGSMGVVYEVVDEELGVRLALKVLRPEATASPRSIKRLRKEVVLARRVTHPNVCRVHDFGTAGRLAYVSMEIVEGDTLATWLARGGIHPDDAVSALVRICRGVAAAHAHGVVHRDLKPGNILLSAEGKLTVMDFGLACDLESELSEAGVVVGTPAYWAPEQARGERATERADVYSIGVIACELLAGERPARGSEKCPRGVPLRYRAVLERCLRRDPAERWADAGELCAALEAARPGRRRRIGLRVALVAAAAALGAAVALGAVRYGSVPTGAPGSLR
jgi:serine/threonine protein kinase